MRRERCSIERKGHLPETTRRPSKIYRAVAASGTPPSEAVEKLCLQRPDLERELRGIHAEQLAAASLLGPDRIGGASEPASGTIAELLETFRKAPASGRDYFFIETIARGGFAVVEKVWDALSLVHGEHFGTVIERVRKNEPRFTLERALQILVQACEAVACAHERNVIHRDLKPQNLMVGRFGETYVMDWGLARVLRKSDSGSRARSAVESLELSTLRADLGQDDGDGGGLLTLEGDVLGTPAFMAPEQAAGKISEIGELADQYSLGAILTLIGSWATSICRVRLTSARALSVTAKQLNEHRKATAMTSKLWYWLAFASAFSSGATSSSAQTVLVESIVACDATTTGMSWLPGSPPSYGGQPKYEQPIDCNVGAIFGSNLNSNPSVVRRDDFVGLATGDITKVVFWCAGFDFNLGVPCDLFSNLRAVRIDIYEWIASGDCGWDTGTLLCTNTFAASDLQFQFECTNPTYGFVSYRVEAILPVHCRQESGKHYAIQIAGILIDPFTNCVFAWPNTGSVTGSVAFSRNPNSGGSFCGPPYFDQAFAIETRVCTQDAGWSNYGAGWAGTLGIPSFTASDDPMVCASFELNVGNSLGATTAAVLFRGFAGADIPSAYGGHLLVLPVSVFPFVLPSAGVSLPVTLPCDPLLCGVRAYFQIWESDPGATKGVSFTRGLELDLGS